jgi:hypothetical protein
MSDQKKNRELGTELAVGAFVAAVFIGLAVFTIVISGKNLFRDNVTDEAEREAIAHFPGSKERPRLHLAVSVRSFRAEKVSTFVDADLPSYI